MLYLLHGTDELTRSEELARLRSKLGDPGVASMNTTVLDGRRLNVTELEEACGAMPFLGERRLVIVEGFWSQFEPPEGSRGREKPRESAGDTALIQALATYLARLPETTHLIFLESRALQSSNPVFGLLPAARERVFVREFSPPADGDLGRWIEERLRSKGGAILPAAARELGRLIGGDTRQLDGELEKLWAYAELKRPITVDDVHLLVSAKHLVDVFDLVDAIGLRKGEAAMRHLHQLLDGGAAPLYLLNMIERQFRILIQVKDQHSRGASATQMLQSLGLRHEFVVKKGIRQARNYSMVRLETIYGRLAEVEQSIKTGEMSDVLALDLLVAELCARS